MRVLVTLRIKFGSLCLLVRLLHVLLRVIVVLAFGCCFVVWVFCVGLPAGFIWGLSIVFWLWFTWVCTCCWAFRVCLLLVPCSLDS